MALKPFYIQTAAASDTEMSCCKKHLHAWWSINALIDCAKMQNIDLGNITIYETFFDYMTSCCEIESTTNIPWNCTLN